MTTGAPLLTPTDVTLELEAIHDRKHRTFTTALFGACERTSVQVRTHDGPKTFEVIPVRCELELREALTRECGPLALLIDFEDRLPLDVRGRLAGGDRHHVTHVRRLARMFGVSTVSADVLAGPLRDALLEDPAGVDRQSDGTNLDLHTAWQWLLHRRFAYPRDESLSRESIARFCATSPDAPRAEVYLSARPALRSALHEYIERTAGKLARIAWQAFERGDGVRFAAMAVLLESATPSVAENGYLRACVVRLLEQLHPGLRDLVSQPALLAEWGALAAHLALRLPATELDAIVTAAQDLLPDPELAEVLGRSPLLPAAFDLGKRHLADALLAACARLSSDTFLACREAFELTRQHRVAGLEPHRELLERARMALRLLAFAMRRVSRKETSTGRSYDDLLFMAQDYAREGCFADFARRAARGPVHEPLAAAIGRVVEMIDRARDRDDLRFAAGLDAWLAANRPASEVVPVDAALERLAVGFVGGNEDRRLLVLLVDGMSWANCVELLDSLEERRFGVALWRTKGSQSAGMLPPMIAALPTITEASRSALFGGKLVEPGKAGDSAKDADRFSEHPAFRKLRGATARLLLRGAVQTVSGDVSKEALELVRSDAVVVGLVLNAIDDQLKAGRQLKVEYQVQTIRPLGPILEAANEAGRAILLLADHGHVPGARMEHVGRGDGGGARYRELGTDEAPREHELVLDCSAAWRRNKGKRLALLIRETDSYGTGSREGEHGGASLAEVVAPAVLIASETLARRRDAEGRPDPEIDVVPFPRPDWWSLELPSLTAQIPARKRTPKAMPAPQLQLGLPEPRTADQPSTPAEAEPSAAGRRLLDAPVWKALPREKRETLRRQIVPRVELLLAHDGRMSATLFAARAGIFAHQVAGAVAQLSEWLNLDGYPVITLERPANDVVLNLVHFDELFGAGS